MRKLASIIIAVAFVGLSFSAFAQTSPQTTPKAKKP